MDWKNKVVDHGLADPSDLLANPLNFRVHPARQQQAMEAVLDDIGFIAPVIVNRTTGRMIDGHLRVALAMRRGMASLPVTYVELTEPEEAEALATFDALGAAAEVDAAKLQELLDEVESQSDTVWDFLDDLAHESGLATRKGDEPGEGGDDFEPDLKEDGPTKTALGDLWRLGEHLLLVGDCTKEENVRRLLAGDQVDLVFTDPPYGVDYVGKTKDALKIDNDALGDAGTRELVADILSVIPIKPGGSFYICSPAGNTETAFRLAIMDAGLELRQCLVWVKQHFVMGRQDYHWRHESILYGWKDGAGHFFVDDRTQDTVWEVDRPMRSTEHPTMKPVALIERAVRNSSRMNDIVYDGCGGSGSTLIGCQRWGRRCRMMEISPNYADVILTRFTAETGLEPELLERVEVP
jgi:DNA modification methylase